MLSPVVLCGCPKAAEQHITPQVDGGPGGAGSNDVEPVYPASVATLPLADKLCRVLAETVENKRATCCHASRGVVVTSECTRMLSAAVRDGAASITEQAVDACASAYERALEGCDWVGPFAPGPPPACQRIVVGQLGEGKSCRSSLECQGGLRCNGVGPTTRGTCGQPKEDGALCGATTDALASFVRASSVLDAAHPECRSGHCIKHRCAAALPERGACQITADCGEGLECVRSGPSGARATVPDRRCVKLALPHEGQPCPGGVCADGLSCVAGTCRERKGAGQSCREDFECKGGCLRDGGRDGKCGMRCDVR